MKRVILMMVAMLTFCVAANAKQRLVYQTDTITGERVVIEVNDTMRNGHAEVDTMSITRYPSGTTVISSSQRIEEDLDEGFKETFSFLGSAGVIAIVFIVVFGIFIGPLLIIAVIFYYRHKNRKAKYELAAKMIEKGEPLPADIEETINGLKDMESKGIRNIFIGGALFVFLWALTDSLGLACIGLLVMANGASQYIIARRTKEKESDTEINQLKDELRRMKEQKKENETRISDIEETNI